jgi:ribosomal protein S18 acetylase RimI-like enzyme
MEVHIRPLGAGEVDALASLAREIWQRHYPGIISQEQIDYMLAERYGRERLQEELACPDIWWDQAFLDGCRVGFASSMLADPGEMKLDKLYVHPDSQRRGVGQRLIAVAAERARGHGCQTLILAVNKNNAQAIAAYRKHGFAVREAVRVDIGHGFVMDDFIMAKSL